MLRFLLLAFLVACSLGGPVFRRPRLDGRIAGGRPVTIDKFPFQVSYEYEGKHICGGSIYSRNWVITAAHCTDGALVTSSQFRAGSSHMGEDGAIHPADIIFQNPNYDFWTFDFDISVVKVSDPFDYGSGVGPIALTTSEPPAGAPATVSGWGTQTLGGSFVTELQAVELDIIFRGDCDKAYTAYGGITENMICAGGNGGGKDACQGDTGGPLVVRNILVGIVSWGFGCANDAFPGVYTNVANLRSFILDTINAS